MVYVNPAQVLYVRSVGDRPRGQEARSVVQFAGDNSIVVEGAVAAVATRLAP
jgi:hypothetical protein